MIGKLPATAPIAPQPGPTIGEALAESWRQIEPAKQARSASAHALRENAGPPGGASRRSLRQMVVDLARPEGLDPALLQNVRTLDLLGHLVDAVLPMLDMEADTRRIAGLMIEEEIAARIDLDHRRVEGAE